MCRSKVVTVIGTRPEAIKMAPVVKELGRRKDTFEHTLVTTAQHRGMLDQVLEIFGIKLDIDLRLTSRNRGLTEFASRSLASVAAALAELEPDVVLIQGDTTTVMTTALAAFYRGASVGHVEAGLRSWNRRSPFPEEVNRRIAGCLSDLHFAPTERARRNLLREGVPEESIFVTGNTIVDALRSIRLEGGFDNRVLDDVDFEHRRVLLVTAHRRENHGPPLRAICAALKALARDLRDIEIVYPVHPNPDVLRVVRDELTGVPNVHLIDPVSYPDLLRVMGRCYLILTDSGGIQEEAPSFRKPVLVLRDVTERPEVIESGAGMLVGTDPRRITRAVTSLLGDAGAYAKMIAIENPFGDGRAAERIVDILAAGHVAATHERVITRDLARLSLGR